MVYCSYVNRNKMLFFLQMSQGCVNAEINNVFLDCIIADFGIDSWKLPSPPLCFADVLRVVSLSIALWLYFTLGKTLLFSCPWLPYENNESVYALNFTVLSNTCFHYSSMRSELTFFLRYNWHITLVAHVQHNGFIYSAKRSPQKYIISHHTKSYIVFFMW